MKFVDSHCHLDDEQFAGDREAVIDRAVEAGLQYALTIGTGNGPPDLGAAIRVAETRPNLFATVGVHPNDAAKVSGQTLADLARLLQHPRVKALGEIGLDYHWGVPETAQMPLFIDQLAMAATARMPVVIHTRDAWADTIRILRDHWAANHLPCVMHCFTGNVQQARECLDLGCMLAFGGVTTFPKASSVREAARFIPLDRMLLETDSPYLAPVPHRGKRNEPAFVKDTAQVIAEVRGILLEDLAAATTANFERVFSIGGEADTVGQLH